jgi:hypothetical protein
MRARSRWRAVPATLCLLAILSGCRDLASEDATGYEPASVEPIEGSDLARVTLTEDAARRIGLETKPVARRQGRIVVPESAIWVDVDGAAWVYAARGPLVFLRARVVVDRYEGGSAFLTEGPPPGTEVASIGVPELIGSEFGV